MITELLLFFLFCFGLTSILMYSSLLSGFRKKICKIEIIGELFNCSMCLGFWIASCCYSLFFEIDLIFPIIIVASSGVTWLLCSITQAMLWQKAYLEVKFLMYEQERLDRVKSKEQELHE